MCFEQNKLDFDLIYITLVGASDGLLTVSTAAIRAASLRTAFTVSVRITVTCARRHRGATWRIR